MTNNLTGNIHSIETCGTVDGPGIRFVIFTQGCPMRCQYCHNPDTWDYKGENIHFLPEEILERYNKVKEFCAGGITVTGGEPLVQIDFLTELFKQAQGKNIHTALDTSGILFDKNNTNKIDILMQYTNLVLLDIKHIDNDSHINLTSLSNKNVLDFANYLCENNIPTWIRYVLVPTVNSSEETLNKTINFIKTLKNVQKIEVLPYHNMAIKKYKELKIEYPFKDIPLPTDEEIALAKKILKI